MCSLFLQFQINLSQTLYADRCADIAKHNLPVLTIHTAQRTAGEEYRPRTVGSRDTRLFPKMQRRPRNLRQCTASAETASARPVRPAFPRTVHTRIAHTYGIRTSGLHVITYCICIALFIHASIYLVSFLRLSSQSLPHDAHSITSYFSIRTFRYTLCTKNHCFRFAAPNPIGSSSSKA